MKQYDPYADFTLLRDGKNAFSRLSELNLCVFNENSALLDELSASVRETVEEGCRIFDPHEITCRRPIAF